MPITNYSFHVFRLRCIDCQGQFATTNPQAQRCPTCRVVYRRQYLRRYRQQQITKPASVAPVVAAG